MKVIEEYLHYFDEYTLKYGNKVCVFYRSGGFFEIYGIVNDHQKRGNVYEIGSMLNLQVSRKNKSILEVDEDNYLMAGFPHLSIDRFVNMITEDHCYIAVIVDQITSPPNPKRAVTRIVSPGTNLTNLDNPKNNYIVCLYIDQISKTNHIHYIGLVALDLSLGECVLYHTSNNQLDINAGLDDIYRMLQTFPYKEITVSCNNFNLMACHELLNYLEIDKNKHLIYTHYNNIPNDYHKIAYQNKVLERICTKKIMITPIEYYELEKYQHITVALCLLINQCYQQNENILSNINNVRFMNSSDQLILDNNCINQLNLIPNGSENSSLLSLINNTSSALGFRLLRDKLLNPITNVEVLNNYYTIIQTGLDNNIDDQLTKYLGNIIDIEKYYRKLSLKMLIPIDFQKFHTSLKSIKEMLVYLNEKHFEWLNSNYKELKISSIDQIISNLDKSILHTENIIDIDVISRNTGNEHTESYFKEGYSHNIDSIKNELKYSQSFFDQLINIVNSLYEKHYAKKIKDKTKDKGVVKLEWKDQLGYHLVTTKCRFDDLLKITKNPIEISINNDEVVKIDLKSIEKEYNKQGNIIYLTNQTIKEKSSILNGIEDKIKKEILIEYNRFADEYVVNYQQLIKEIIKLVSYIDLIKSYIKTSRKLGYTKPIIKHIDQHDSFFSCKGIRHPLIEQMSLKEEYVPIDIDFQTHRGIVLFGVNCSGKSSLMKSIGMNLVLAQIGMYVPATELVYYPYTKILTRIIGNDNIFKALSSYGVEITELRGILNRVDNRSMVLCDELSKGSETISGTALVASTIIKLSQSNSTFITASHLHDLAKIDELTSIKNIKFCHLKVDIDKISNKITYNRQLVDGIGSTIYGLEIAQAMGIDECTMQLAYKIRNKLLNKDQSNLTLKKSRYNSDLYYDKCQMPFCNNVASNTHHIKYQCDANKDTGIIGHLHKNHLSNLIPLCDECHHSIHQNKLKINGFKLTSNGWEIEYIKSC